MNVILFGIMNSFKKINLPHSKSKHLFSNTSILSAKLILAILSRLPETADLFQDTEAWWMNLSMHRLWPDEG